MNMQIYAKVDSYCKVFGKVINRHLLKSKQTNKEGNRYQYWGGGGR